LDGEGAAEAAFGELGERQAEAGEAVAGEERERVGAEFGRPVVAAPRRRRGGVVIEGHDPAHGAFGRGGLGKRERSGGGQSEAFEERVDEARRVGEGVVARGAVALEPTRIAPEGGERSAFAI